MPETATDKIAFAHVMTHVVSRFWLTTPIRTKPRGGSRSVVITSIELVVDIDGDTSVRAITPTGRSIDVAEADA